MANPYIGEIRMFAGTFPPEGWMFCEGQLLSIVEYQELFQLIGTTYGGDGQRTFGLPDLRGRLPIHHGPGLGLPTYVIGEMGGVEEITLTEAQISSHTHGLQASTAAATSASPEGNTWAAGQFNTYVAAPASVGLATAAVSSAGEGQPHTNMQPYLCINFIISLFGVYPAPNS
ncbi:MAG: phage tail protein [Chloroflexi bacterium]|nr:MAG: phage tail protein [Chloroflexota bacterium]